MNRIMSTEGQPSNGAGPANSLGAGALLDAEEYKRRFVGAQQSIYKSLLVLLALFAFWLAMESNFTQFEALSEEALQRRSAVMDVKRDTRRVQTIYGERLALSVGSTTEAEHSFVETETINRLKREKEELEKSEAGLAQISNKLEELREETVQLSILGTSLPSPLSLAPTIWLVALLCWLHFFRGKRATAQVALAAFCLADVARRKAFGAAGEGSVWLAPLPRKIEFVDDANGTASIATPELLWSIGWSEGVERRFRLVLVLATALIGILVVLVLRIAYEMSGQVAETLKFISGSWRIPALIIPPAVAALCFLQLVLLPVRATLLTSKGEASALLSRRDAIAMLGGAAAAAILNWRHLLLNGEPPERVAKNKAPRFIPEKAKLARQRNRQTFLRMSPHKSSLVYSSRGLQEQRGKSRSQISVHASDNDGSVRLFSKAANKSRLEKLQLDEADRWIKASEALIRTTPPTSPGSVRELPLGAQRTSPWEALALQHLQNRNFDTACDILMLGSRLTTRLPSAHPINVRLLDLLAGLAIRAGQRKKYLDPLILALNDRIKQLDAIAQNDRKYPQRAMLVSRIAKWRHSDSKWAQRWANKEAPVTWHHPYELENRSSTSTLKSRVRHQRSVEIA